MSFKELADELKVSTEEAQKRWQSAKLDGDERRSVAYAFGLDYDGPGAVGTARIQTGLDKLRTKPKTTVDKKKK